MTAVVSRERAKATFLTGAAGVLMLAVAFVMMVVAAPGQVHSQPPAVQFTADVGHQLTSRSDSATARACQAGPAAESACAEAYVPSMITQSWSASSAVRAVRPPLVGPAVS